VRQNLWRNHKSNRCGICIGNNFGGWGYVEPQMEGLYNQGMDFVNPYVATAWFPAAAQGEISIEFGIKGHSKTFSAERLSSGVAIEYSKLLLEDGTLDWVLAGGTEAPDADVVLSAMYEQGLADETIPAGEAACLMLLSGDPSNAMGAISGIARASDVGYPMTSALLDAGCEPADIDCVFLDRPRGKGAARSERFADQLRTVVSLFGSPCSVALPLPFGETVGAAMAVDIAVACVALQSGTAPASEVDSKTGDLLSQEGFRLLASGLEVSLKKILLNASDEFNQAMSLVVSRPE
jgi:3-oxoacyl-[acyl-carrier-protein] synthase II